MTRHLAVILPVVGLLAWSGLWSTVAVRSSSAELRRAKDAMVEARSLLGTADAAGAEDALDRAEHHLDAAALGLARTRPSVS